MAPVRVLRGIDEVRAVVGVELGASEWMVIDQGRIDAFAGATGDFEWIHVDPDRAAAGPFGSTIAHGFLTLTLIPGLREEIFSIETERPRLNYGLDRVRFPAPVPVNSRIRMHAVIAEVSDIPSGVLTRTRYTFEIEGSERPACVADMLELAT